VTDPRADALVEWVRARPAAVLEPGLSAAELAAAEAAYGVTFPPLWRAVLARVHPVDPPGSRPGRPPSWPDWRQRDPDGLRHLVDGPVDGLLFDVDQNWFWWRAWGPRPASHAERLAVARDRLAGVPRLVPLHGHQYVGATDDSPVFSIVQADLWVPAVTLADVATGRDQSAVPDEEWPLGTVPFWSELHAWSQIGHYDPRFAGLGEGGL
jgi:hypothetical protein